MLEATQAAILGLIINQIIGLFYFHPRPNMIGLCAPLFAHSPETSFPSDHATLLFSAAFYLLIVRGWFSCGISLLVIALLTAWGRVYSGIHFPFDMAGSIVVALTSTVLMRWLTERLNPLNKKLILVSHQLLGFISQSRSHGTRQQTPVMQPISCHTSLDLCHAFGDQLKARLYKSIHAPPYECVWLMFELTKGMSKKNL